MMMHICFFLLGWFISKYYTKIKLTIILYNKRKIYFDAMDNMIKTQEFTEKFYKENEIKIPHESDIPGNVYNLEWLQRSPKAKTIFTTPELHALKCEAKLCWRGCTKEYPC